LDVASAVDRIAWGVATISEERLLMRFLHSVAAVLLAGPLVLGPIGSALAQATPPAAPAAPADTTPTAPMTPGMTMAPGTTMAPGGAMAPAAPKTPRKRQTLQQRFDAANTTHDGHLTLDQATAAKWTYIVKHFTAIDAGKKGYVTVADIRAYAKAMHTAKHMTPKTASPGTTN
jgi:hypothetical protein